MDDVAVGQNETIRCENETRATATHLLRKAKTGRLFSSRTLVDFDIDNGWANSFRRIDDRPRISIKKIIIRNRDGI
jgi:hypothetical protein